MSGKLISLIVIFSFVLGFLCEETGTEEIAKRQGFTKIKFQTMYFIFAKL
jgi:hypothetical protein